MISLKVPKTKIKNRNETLICHTDILFDEPFLPQPHDWIREQDGMEQNSIDLSILFNDQI